MMVRLFTSSLVSNSSNSLRVHAPFDLVQNLTRINNSYADTGANVNTLDSRIVDKFQLPVAYTAQELNILGRAGVGGTFDSSDQALYRLGDCRLSGMPAEFSKVTFMTNLTVASLPFPGPTGAGLLGLPFFGSFSGVEFDWHGTDGDPPTMVFFFYDVPDLAKNNTKRLEIDMSLLVPALDISVNGVELRAILDTGSPLTIFSEEAARITGVAVVDSEDLVDPLAIDSAPRRESLGDDVLTIGGVDGNHLSLHKSKSCTIKIQSGDVSFGSGSVYVGNLPLFSMMESQQFPFNSSNSSRPSIILGLDALRRTYRMILRISSGEVWLEELSGQI